MLLTVESYLLPLKWVSFIWPGPFMGNQSTRMVFGCQIISILKYTTYYKLSKTEILINPLLI